ncbi:hypothetical protein BDN72DRAFT_846760 [Pluteus cervinus]|uniref:Uncharacterized protein n=1 Tax=Pluteus cervinus TaxID=181527 RepID=A0ACD3AF28_9AGAR|nr:hypothetical protein BDN72DRAFT_846760 [Pluteus cervinus]
MIRRPSLRTCFLGCVYGFPFSISNDSQIHNLGLRDFAFSNPETPASASITNRPIQLHHLEYSPASTRNPLYTVVTPVRDSVRNLGFDLSNLQSLVLDFRHHIPGIANLLIDCSESLQSLIVCGEVEIDLSPLSRIRNLVLEIFIDSGDGTTSFVADVATLETLNPTRLQNVTLDLCLTEIGVPPVSSAIWNSLDTALFRLFKDRVPLGTITLKLRSFWLGDDLPMDLYPKYTEKLPKCQEAGLLVYSVRKIQNIQPRPESS